MLLGLETPMILMNRTFPCVHQNMSYRTEGKIFPEQQWCQSLGWILNVNKTPKKKKVSCKPAFLFLCFLIYHVEQLK